MFTLVRGGLEQWEFDHSEFDPPKSPFSKGDPKDSVLWTPGMV